MSIIMLKVSFSMIITIGSYLLTLTIYRKYKKNWLNPLYTGSALLILILFIFHIHGETYQQVNFLFNQLMQLAVVTLAVPLYKQWSFLKKNYKKIFAGVTCGTLFGVASVIALGQLFHLNEQLQASLIPRSVTLPIALTIATDLGGLTSTTIIFVIISALFSVMIGPKLLQHFGIKSKSAKGLAMGTTAQMLGANRSFGWGEEEGAMGNVAMTTSALFLAILVPIVPYIF